MLRTGSMVFAKIGSGHVLEAQTWDLLLGLKLGSDLNIK